MSKLNIPWQDKPEGFAGPIWRYTNNPVIDRDPNPELARVFNSSIIPYKDGYIGVFRAESSDNVPYLFLGRSQDGIHIEVDTNPIKMVYEDGEPDDSQYQYDPRLIQIGDTYYIIYCDDFFDAPTIQIAYTKDFVTFKKVRHPFPPQSRNGVLFPEQFNGKWYMLYRPVGGVGNIYLAKSEDLRHWGEYQLLMSRTKFGWGKYKIGGGCNPIKTKEGWLLIYHGVIDTCDGLVYSIGGALLDLNDPSKVLYRAKRYLLTPQLPYETTGFVPNVCFPCSALVDEETGRVAIYYGGADSVVALGFSTLDTLINWIKTR